jgi:hypothetical protein
MVYPHSWPSLGSRSQCKILNEIYVDLLNEAIAKLDEETRQNADETVVLKQGSMPIGMSFSFIVLNLIETKIVSLYELILKLSKVLR